MGRADARHCLRPFIARVCRPGSKLATTRWWADTTLAADLGVSGASTDEVYAAMDWLAGRQDAIEKLASRHLSPEANPDRLALFDLSSSWVTGQKCPAARGYSRDGKKGLEQIEYGLLTDPAGRPSPSGSFPATPPTRPPSRPSPGLQDPLPARGHAHGRRPRHDHPARIDQLKELGGLGWVTALRAPQIKALAADDGPLQMSLFDQPDLARDLPPRYPGNGYRLPQPGAGRRTGPRRRGELLDATEAELGKIVAAVAAGPADQDAGKISGSGPGKSSENTGWAKHFSARHRPTPP